MRTYGNAADDVLANTGKRQLNPVPHKNEKATLDFFI